jgi:putative endonuclease
MAIPLRDTWLVRLKRWLLPRLGNTDHIGRLAEDAACRMLRDKGWTIRHRNARTPKGEADIIADAPSPADVTHVIIEVKSRVRKADAPPRSNATSPLASITHDKRDRLRAITQHLQRANKWPRSQVRIDVIAIEFEAIAGRPHVKSIEHLENAIAL